MKSIIKGALAPLAATAWLTSFSLPALAQPVEYVRVCTPYGAGWYYVPGTDTCVYALTGETRKQTEYGTLRILNRVDLALQGVAMAMATPTPVVEWGKSFAIAGNAAYYEGASALGLAGAMRITQGINFTGSLTYGIQGRILATRFGLNITDLSGAKSNVLGLSEPGDGRRMANQNFSVNASIYSGLWANEFQISNDGESSTTLGYLAGGLVRAKFLLNPHWSLQLDGWTQVANTVKMEDVHPDTEAVPIYRHGAAGHLTYSDNESLLGGFVSAGYLGSYNVMSSFNYDAHAYSFGTIGIEGQTTWGDFVGYAQIGMTMGLFEPPMANQISGAYVHLAVRKFVNPNLMVEANGGYTHFEYDSSVNANVESDLYRWGLRLEKKLEDRNISLYGEYQGNYLDRPRDQSQGWFIENTVMIGAKFMVNEGTLRNSIVKGASLADYNPIYGLNHRRE